MEEENTCLDEILYDVRAIPFASNPEILGLGAFISDSRDYLVKRSLLGVWETPPKSLWSTGQCAMATGP